MTGRHPYRDGNYAPVQTEVPLTACDFTAEIPPELAGGMYIRNGSNPASTQSPSPSRSPAEPSYHWFDGDGMLAGVFFESTHGTTIVPSFVNRFVLTDVLLASSSSSFTPLLPSIATLLGPLSALPTLLYSITRAATLAALSRFTETPIDRISVANTAVVYHGGKGGGRALATCESGPPMVFRLPGLETEGWWDLDGDGGEIGLREKAGKIKGWMLEWCTAHPKTDPITGELVLFHSSLLPPYLHYSVIPATTNPGVEPLTPRILAAPVPIPNSRMMHDLGVSPTYTVLIDMPLSLDPLNLLRGKSVVYYSPSTPARFGIFPRHFPGDVRWFETPACVIFHTALTYDSDDAVNLLCCRLNSSTLVYAAGNLEMPKDQLLPPGQKDTCELYYFRFPLDPPPLAVPTHAFSLSAVPFEFPCTPARLSMSAAKFVYGCTLTSGSFSAALGSAAKIDALVKINVKTLIALGIDQKISGNDSVDERTVAEVIASQQPRTATGEDRESIRIFAMPSGWYAQEATFVERENPRDEDDGFLITYVFDEAQLDVDGYPRADAKSELWIIDAWDMSTVVSKILLPQRVPYGLHGKFFTKEQIEEQRPFVEARRRKDPVVAERINWGENLRSRIVRWLD